jgi:hypothetical protein
MIAHISSRPHNVIEAAAKLFALVVVGNTAASKQERQAATQIHQDHHDNIKSSQ